VRLLERSSQLMIGSENAGDFHDWPETWQRSRMLRRKIKSDLRASLYDNNFAGKMRR
jgi:hypothetical protein